MTDLEALAVDRVPCSRCHQMPGHRCRTVTDAWTTYPHSCRMVGVNEAWLLGYHDGFNDAKAEYSTQQAT